MNFGLSLGLGYRGTGAGGGGGGVAPPVEPPLLTMTPQTSIEYNSRTIAFYDASTGGNPVAVPCGISSTGALFVDSRDLGTVWAEWTPLSSLDGSSRWQDGVMFNPLIGTSYRGPFSQGYDQGLSVTRNGKQIAYTDAQNIGKARFQITPNSRAVYRKAKRLAVLLANQDIERVDQMNVVDYAPWADEFDLAASNPGLMRVSMHDVQVSHLRKLAIPAGMPSIANALSWNIRTTNEGAAGEMGQRLLGYEAALGPIPVNEANYAGNHATYTAAAGLYLSLDISDADKLDLAANEIWNAIQLAGLISMGYENLEGAAQEARQNKLAIAFALTAKTEFATAFFSHGSVLTNARLVTPELEASSTTTPFPNTSADFRYQTPWMPEDIGRWAFRTPAGTDSSPIARYLDTARNGLVTEMASLLPLNMRSGGTFWSYLTANYPGTKYEGAVYDAWERATMTPVPAGAGSVDANGKEILLTSIGDLGISAPAYPPQAMVTTYVGNFNFNNAVVRMTAGAGSLIYDWAAYDPANGGSWGIHPITAVRKFLSLDRRQIVEVGNTTGWSQTITDLPGGAPLVPGLRHFGGLILENAHGASMPTPMHMINDPAVGGSKVTRNPYRMDATPTGAAITTAPAFVVDPVLMVPRKPGWLGRRWEPAPTLLPENTGFIAAGAGYVNATPTSWEAKYQRADATYSGGVLTVTGSWSDVTTPSPVATADLLPEFEVVKADEGKALRGAVRAINAGGGSFAFTAPVFLPNLTAVNPDDRLLTFGGEFKRKWPLTWSTAFGTNATLTHDPDFVLALPEDYEGELQTSPGVLGARKTAGNPILRFNVAADLEVSSGDYEVTIELPLGFRGAANNSSTEFWNSDGIFSMRLTSTGGTDLFTAIPIVTTGNAIGTFTKAVRRLTATFTIAAPTSNLWVYLQKPTSSGGTSGGSPAVSSLRLRRL